MKKWSWILLVLSVILVYWLWPKASIEKPIVVSAQVMESTSTMTISYITTKKDDTHLMEVAVNGKGFYAPSRTENGAEGRNNQVARKLTTQNGYQLREATIKLNKEELAYLLPDDSNRTFSADFSFADYSPVKADGILLLEDEAAEGSLEQDQLHYTFTASEPLSVFTIGHYSSVATVSWSHNGREMKLPLAMEKGDMLDIHFDGTYQMGSTDELLLEIQTAGDNYYTKHLKETVQLPDGYLKQLVNENRKLSY
ncbi:hypothetical protein QL992_03335 [Microbacterium sp. APC 3898]|uniref:Uncharacterized protein n=1 Tax=Planococcus notacanthi TaxID=3035188 RepID=A0ABT7ZM77_9BACL|nr:MULTISPECIES: hypothetical protein [Terrabacteria group]MDN3428231.1 hypothetical protein [Planococcus sp. APC 4016]MDN3498231.1 hypothetical protein [Microbacterium sp. APC 3898]